MRNFLFDLWQDLRERRLLPVAIALAAAVLATPVLLLKGSPDKSVAAAPGAVPSAAPPLVTTASLEDASKLDVFDSKNPFRPLRKLASAESGATAGGNPFSSGASDKSGGGQASATSDSGGASGSTGGGGGPTSGGEGSGGGFVGLPAPRKPAAKSRKYTYVIDLTVTGRTTHVLRGFHRLGLLPSRANPLAIFLGVTARGDDAVFLLDGTVRAVGEGRCKPRDAQCSLLYLSAGEQHELIASNGDSYLVRLDQVRKVRVRKAARARSTSKRRRAARPGAGEGMRAFMAPVLVDLIEVGAGR
jgi:hypothetical protein